MTPTIIFVHGLGLSGEAWAPQREWCRKHDIESVALTLPGHGSRRNDAASIEGMVDEIIATARRFEKVVLVGYSFGAFLCGLAVPRIPNVEDVIFINPLLEAKQIKGVFFIFVKAAKMMQRFFGVRKRPGEFSQGTKWFWRWGIYPYCLACNPMDIVEKLYGEIKKLRRVSLPSHIPYAVLVSQNDELLRPVDHEKSITIPLSGHMLFRLAPEEISRFLVRAVLRRKEHYP